MASIIVSVLPASAPPGPVATPSRISISRPPSGYVPSARPAPAIASVTSATRPAPARQTTPGRLGREVDSVEDDLDDDVVARERGARDARVAVPERTHRVEEVRDRAHADVERGVRLLCGRVRVAARDDDLAAQERLDQRVRARQLRCERDEADGSRLEQPLEEVDVRVAPRAGWVDPESQRREERALEVNAQDPRAVRALGRHRGARR